MNFQDVILKLQDFWSDYGCCIVQPLDIEVGAGTFNPSTFFRVIGPEPWNTAYVEPSRRPTDGRYGENPNRLQHYFQFQVILKPSPDDVQDLYLKSLEVIGIDAKEHDIRFVEDDWESPTLGAWGLGWEVWLNGMEVTQFTYFQQVGGIDLNLYPLNLHTVLSVFACTCRALSPFTISNGMIRLLTVRSSTRTKWSSQSTTLNSAMPTCCWTSSINMKLKVRSSAKKVCPVRHTNTA